MKALIKTKKDLKFMRDSDYKKNLESLAGKWVNIDTDNLFNNQYNTIEHNLRIFDGDIERIVDDARINKGNCGYCGNQLKAGEKCRKHNTPLQAYGIDSTPNECSHYGINWFTEKNCYFIKYPMGFNHTEKFYKKLRKESLKIGSYTLNFDGEFFTLGNYRKSFKFKYDGINFILHGSCGFNMKRKLDIPHSALTKLKNVLTNGVK